MRKILSFAVIASLALVGPEIRVANAQFKACSPATWSAESATAVTTSDATVYNPPSRALYVGGDGNVTVRLSVTQANATFVGILAGTVLPVCVDMVYATGTTATNIVLLR